MTPNVNGGAFGGRELAVRVVREAGLWSAMLPGGSVGTAGSEDPCQAAYVLALGARFERAEMAPAKTARGPGWAVLTLPSREARLFQRIETRGEK